MRKQKIADIIKSDRILVSDGAWGTLLYERGLKAGECPEEWCLTRFDEVSDIAMAYINAGADSVRTNSFGGNRFKLANYGLADRVSEINEAAARASRAAAGENRWVLGSIGPTGKMLITGEVSEDELYRAFAEQVVALEKGGADAILVETMSCADEAALAVRAAKENTRSEVVCTFTFEKTLRGEYRTMMGVSPEAALMTAIEAGADITGANCGNGFAGMTEIVKIMRAANKSIPLLIHANAGIPKNIGGRDIFPETPQYMAGLVPLLISAGVNIIGGCCGTTPDHIRAIKEAVAQIIRK